MSSRQGKQHWCLQEQPQQQAAAGAPPAPPAQSPPNCSPPAAPASCCMAACCCACCWGWPCERAGHAGRWVGGQWQQGAQTAHASRMAPAARSHCLALSPAGRDHHFAARERRHGLYQRLSLFLGGCALPGRLSGLLPLQQSRVNAATSWGWAAQECLARCCARCSSSALLSSRLGVQIASVRLRCVQERSRCRPIPCPRSTACGFVQLQVAS